MRAMLDTNTCIYAMKRREGFEARLPLRECGISIIVLGELEWGACLSDRKRDSLAAIHDIVGAVQVVELDAEVARRYGQLRAHLRSIGQPIGPNDLWIAAHALARDVPLITHNLAEFQRVPGLTAETWMTG
ncbi:MAG: type II toxin-antitoxin system VapC family toxin [Acidobacteria bacterium]|nr:type II toxin-antitoxin system VapC family toxin [Acidobacteriota bacterium]